MEKNNVNNSNVNQSGFQYPQNVSNVHSDQSVLFSSGSVIRNNREVAIINDHTERVSNFNFYGSSSGASGFSPNTSLNGSTTQSGQSAPVSFVPVILDGQRVEKINNLSEKVAKLFNIYAGIISPKISTVERRVEGISRNLGNANNNIATINKKLEEQNGQLGQLIVDRDHSMHLWRAQNEWNADSNKKIQLLHREKEWLIEHMKMQDECIKKQDEKIEYLANQVAELRKESPLIGKKTNENYYNRSFQSGPDFAANQFPGSLHRSPKINPVENDLNVNATRKISKQIPTTQIFVRKRDPQNPGSPVSSDSEFDLV